MLPCFCAHRKCPVCLKVFTNWIYPLYWNFMKWKAKSSSCIILYIIYQISFCLWKESWVLCSILPIFRFVLSLTAVLLAEMTRVNSVSLSCDIGVQLQKHQLPWTAGPGCLLRCSRLFRPGLFLALPICLTFVLFY